MRQVLVLLAALVAMAVGPIVHAGKYDSVVKIVNESLWDIHHLYLSSVDDEEWGPDQLGDAVIGSGETFQLRGIPCDDYDVRIVDEDGDSCVVGGVTLCGGKDSWVITDEDLLTCQAVTDE
ncbi:MAG: hypothetical protein IPG63_11230 [Xanthomonadales bacterium]|nr:hypothetical protein [Xanthomonadales bacterium]MCC6562348.1 hypothetical protein [Xanthomonadales bacterium]